MLEAWTLGTFSAKQSQTMSLNRFVYYCAVVGGWMAFLAGMLLERPIRHLSELGESAAAMQLWDTISATLTATAVGGAIGCGLGLVSATSKRWQPRLRHAGAGAVGGAVGGLIGGLVGAALYTYIGLPRALGWAIMGVAIGAAEGLHQNSFRRMANGAIGGALGGLLGGMLFGLIATRPEAAMASRAVGFTALGITIGALIGLAHVVLKQAWLTVLDGFRPGRQLILDQAVTVLGRGDHLPLPLLGPSAKDLETEHARITLQTDGRYVVEDRQSRIGTMHRGQQLSEPAILEDGDLLRLGGNILRFNQRMRTAAGPQAEAAASEASGKVAPAPPTGPPPPVQTPPAAPAGDRPLPGGAIAPQPGRPGQGPPPTSPGGGSGPKIPPPPPPPPSPPR